MKNFVAFLKRVSLNSVKLQKKTGQDKIDLAFSSVDMKSEEYLQTWNLMVPGVIKQKQMSIKHLPNPRFSTRKIHHAVNGAHPAPYI